LPPIFDIKKIRGMEHTVCTYKIAKTKAIFRYSELPGHEQTVTVWLFRTISRFFGDSPRMKHSHRRRRPLPTQHTWPTPTHPW
jgi:hypothetical protein